MLYLCEIKDNVIRPYLPFQNETEFAAYLTYHSRYDSLIADQNLTGNDMYRLANYDDYVPDKYILRTSCLIDEHNRILDVRDYEHLIPASKDVYDAWYKRVYNIPNGHRRFRKQGRTHRKWYHYTHMTKETDFDPDITNNEFRLRHINRIKGRKTRPYDDMIEQNENNWKSTKSAHQYMWHKPRHTFMITPSTSYDADYMMDPYDADIPAA